MDARKFLHTVGSEVSSDFVKNRSILSFEEYIALFMQSPRQQARNAAGYLKDAIDHFGTMSFGRTWPVLLIVFGLFKLAERSAATKSTS